MSFEFLIAAEETAAKVAEKAPSGFVNVWGGYIMAILGVVLAIVFAGIGSAFGVKYAASAGLGLMSEEPKRFMPCLVLSLLPSTQGIYGFVVAFMLFGKVAIGMGFQEGMTIFLAALPVGIIGFFSAILQGKVAAAGVNLAAKQPAHWSKAMILALTVEMFALFGFLISIFMMG